MFGTVGKLPGPEDGQVEAREHAGLPFQAMGVRKTAIFAKPRGQCNGVSGLVSGTSHLFFKAVD